MTITARAPWLVRPLRSRISPEALFARRAARYWARSPDRAALIACGPFQWPLPAAAEAAVVGEVSEELYSTPEDALATAGALGLGGRGRYILSAAFGNVHDVGKPGRTNPVPLERAPRTRVASLGDMPAAGGQSA